MEERTSSCLRGASTLLLCQTGLLLLLHLRGRKLDRAHRKLPGPPHPGPPLPRGLISLSNFISKPFSPAVHQTEGLTTPAQPCSAPSQGGGNTQHPLPSLQRPCLARLPAASAPGWKPTGRTRSTFSLQSRNTVGVCAKRGSGRGFNSVPRRQVFPHLAEARVTVHSRNVWPHPVSRERVAIWVEWALGERKGGWHLQKCLFEPVASSGGDLWDNT